MLIEPDLLGTDPWRVWRWARHAAYVAGRAMKQNIRPLSRGEIALFRFENDFYCVPAQGNKAGNQQECTKPHIPGYTGGTT